MQTDRSALFNLSSAAGAEICTKAAQFATVVLIARTLGPADFGIVGAAWALYQMALPLVQTAPELIGVRNLSADRARAIHWVAVIGTIKMLLAVGAVLALVAYAAMVYGAHSRHTEQIDLQALVLFAVAASPAWAARSFQRTDLYAVPRLLQAVLFVALVGGGLAIHPTPLTVPIAECAAWAIASICAFRLLRPLLSALSLRRSLALPSNLRKARAAIAASGRETFHLAASGIAAAAIWWGPVLMAETLFGSVAGGNVAAAIRLVLIALVTVQLCLQVFLPVLSKYYAIDRRKFRTLVADLAFYSTLAHSAVAVAIAILAAPLAHLVFGPGFDASVLLMVILAVALIPLGIGSAYGYALIAANRTDTYFLVVVLCSIGALISQGLGMIVTGSPNGLVWDLPSLVIMTLVLAIYAHGGGLVDARIFSLHRLAPRNIMLFFRER